MQVETIKKHILNVAQRDLRADYIYDCPYNSYFPDESLLDFLGRAVRDRAEIKVFYHAFRHNFYSDYKIRLELIQRKKSYDLGFYTYEKRHAKYFEPFFSYFFDDYSMPLVLESSNGCRYSYLDKVTKEEFAAFIRKEISEDSEKYDYDYTPEFCEIMANYANTRQILKIIVMDSEGDYYVTLSRIWAMKTLKGLYWDFENTQRDSCTPDYIQKAHYICFDRKIVQILDNQKVLYSGLPYTDSEMRWRKNFLENQIKAFCEKLKEKE